MGKNSLLTGLWMAALAIVGAVISLGTSIGSMFAGKPDGALEAAAKVATTAQKLAELIKKVAKIVALVIKIVKLCNQIVAAARQISNAKEFADQMAEVRHEAEA